MSEGRRQVGDTVGDYRLERACSEGQLTEIWEAEQISMQRDVMLEMLKALPSQDAGFVASFLADVKAKALVSHPGIGAVYEAVSNDKAVLFARERIEGEALETRRVAGVKYEPLEVVKILKQVSESMLHLENEGVATVEYDLDHIIIGSNEQVRLMNLAVDGERDGQAGTRTKQRLGEAFREMLADGYPGATRVGSLCDFMRDQERPVPLTWSQISGLSEQVRAQLEGTGPIAPPVNPEAVHAPRQGFKVPPAGWALLGGFALIAALVGFIVFATEDKKPVAEDVEELSQGPVEVPAGDYTVGGDQFIAIREGFTMNRAEVTFAQYNAFLEFPNHKKFEHPDQPRSKKGHQPKDWENAWPAAIKGENWRKRKMSMDSPVVGVDWWDAYAYAKWSQGRLPTLAEWSVAAQFEGKPEGAKGWGSVTLAQDDETGAGLIGMAGGVREWTANFEVNPAFELSPKKPVAAGGSFLEREKGIETRLWLEDRSVREPDLGFRIISVK